MKEKERLIPLVPLEDVLKCMNDKDEVVRMAAKTYYNQYYLNRSQNERLKK